MLSFFKNVFKKGELRRRIIFTLGMLFVFRLGAAITIPSINAGALTGNATNSGILGIMNMLGGEIFNFLIRSFSLYHSIYHY